MIEVVPEAAPKRMRLGMAPSSFLSGNKGNCSGVGVAEAPNMSEGTGTGANQSRSLPLWGAVSGNVGLNGGRLPRRTSLASRDGNLSGVSAPWAKVSEYSERPVTTDVIIPGRSKEEAMDPTASVDAVNESIGTVAEPRLPLSEEQKNALDIVKRAENVFLTGCGGTGKSFVLREIIREMKEMYGAENVGVTAMTGVAAENVGGCTLHSLLGIGIPYMKDDFNKMGRGRNKNRILQLRALVIDEVSMLSGEMLDLMDRNFRSVRRCAKPFGGLHVVLCGDFYQLPPINSLRLTSNPKEFNNLGMAFQSKAWREGKLELVDLKEVHRQSDKEFILALADLRRGQMTERVEQLLKCSRRTVPEKDGIKPTELYCLNQQVDTFNRNQLRMIKSQEKEFMAIDKTLPSSPGEPGWQREKLETHSFWKSCRAAKNLVLKEGAQVMLLKNFSQEKGNYLVNGSRGIVESFEDKKNVW